MTSAARGVGRDGALGGGGASPGATPKVPATCDQSVLGRGGGAFLAAGAGGRAGGGTCAAGFFCFSGGWAGGSAPNDEANEFQ